VSSYSPNATHHRIFRPLTPNGCGHARRFLLASLTAFCLLGLPVLRATPTTHDQGALAAQTPATKVQSGSPPPAQRNSSGQQPSTQQAPLKKPDRMFFVMPNYLSVDNESEVQPISWKQKFAITAKGTFDPYEFAMVGIVSGIRQAENAYPSFGQGMAGYGKRYGAAFADQADGNIMVGGVFPSLLRTDPRYFRLGREGHFHRFLYAFSRIFVTRKDSGGNTFNVSELAGNATAIGISNAYYPAANRSLSSNLSNWGTQVSIDAFGNELKEFWPDIHRYLLKRKNKSPAPANKAPL
jgi:hypothetical protein